MSSICVFGSANADVVLRSQHLPRPGMSVHVDESHLLSGGKSANQAVAAARLGGSVGFVGAVGNDDEGRFIRTQLSKDGIDLSHLKEVDTPTGRAYVVVEDSGENFILVEPGANGTVSEGNAEEAREALTNAKVLGLSFEVQSDAVQAAAALAHAGGALVVCNPSPYRAPKPSLLAHVDVLVVNEEELSLLARDFDVATGDVKQMAKALAHRGLPKLVVTLGSKGALVVTHSGDDVVLETVASPRVHAIDTTGCGDAFTGALLFAMSGGVELTRAARFACHVGAVAATALGAQASYPTGGVMEERYPESVREIGM